MNKHHKLAFEIKNIEIPKEFSIINFPVIPCSSNKITYLNM